MFYLGTHKPQWLARPEFAAVPLFLSRRELAVRVALPRAVGRYAVDSGGFTELQKYGRWVTTPADYVAELRRFWAGVGPFDWAAPQDMMCEPVVLAGGRAGGVTFAGTGLTVRDHQERTVSNLLQLRRLAPELPIIPVLQGFALADYLRCADLYAAAGVDLEAEPTVGVGSVCRRQATDEIGELVAELGAAFRVHGFGVKSEGLKLYGHHLASADSLAWSFTARREAHHRVKAGQHPSRLGCRHGVDGRGSCANCPAYALDWRRRNVPASRYDGGHG